MKKIILFYLCSCFFFATLAQAKNKQTLLGYINHKPIYTKDIETKNINTLRIQLYLSLKQAFINHAITLLGKQGIHSKKIDPSKITKQEIKDFYDKNNLSLRGSLSSLSGSIRQYLTQQKQQQINNQFFASLSKKNLVKFIPSKPNELFLLSPLETAFLINPKIEKTAKVAFIEFSDYQCPFCRRFDTTFNRLQKKYKSKVLFSLRNFPLDFHDQALHAALAAECLRDQNALMAFHKAIFALQPKEITTDKINSLSHSLASNNAKFDACLSSKKHLSRINKDLERGKELGINGTPSHFIGFYDKKTRTVHGRLVIGAVPYETIAQTIEYFLNSENN